MSLPENPRPGATPPPDSGIARRVTLEPFRLTSENFPGYQEYMEKIAGLPSTADQLAAVGLTPKTAQEAREKKQLAGGVFLVIGTGPGSMGEAAAREIAARGGIVVAVTRSESGARVVEEIKRQGGKAVWIGADITKLHDGPKQIMIPDPDPYQGGYSKKDDPNQIGNFLNSVIQKGQELHAEDGRKPEDVPSLDGLIIASGARKDGFVIRMDRKQIEEVMDANFTAPALLTKEAYAKMRGNPGGIRMGVMSSEAAKGAPLQANYAAAKGAITAWCLSMDAEIRETGRGNPSTVSVASPGLVATSFVEELTDNQRVRVLVATDASREIHPTEAGILLAHMVTPEGAESTHGRAISLIGRGKVVNFDRPNGYHGLDHW